MIPDEWKIEPGQSKKCSFDTDSDAEWLVVFRYDTTKVSSLADTTALEVTRGPIGAAIFDTQPPQLKGRQPSPYRPNLVIPYRLLPDIYPNKGQGYLGESPGQADNFLPTHRKRQGGAGSKRSPSLATVTAFCPPGFRYSAGRAGPSAIGTAHFAGTARIGTRDPIDGSKLVRQVTTYKRVCRIIVACCASFANIWPGRGHP